VTAASILWRRLDIPGHDACCVTENDVGAQLDGAAAFLQGGAPVQLTYSVACDRTWRTQHGRVRGWIGVQAVDFSIARLRGGDWTLNGAIVDGIQACIDLDFGFTPSTNLLQLRRLALAVGQSAVNPVAWFDVSTGTLDVLLQRYERRSQNTYWYEAPRFEYSALLELASSGFVRRYPGLWEAEPAV